MSDPVRLYLGYFIVPLWLAAGVGDWACHRKEGIERNAGTRESLLHALMLAEVGLPVLIALFFDINATVFAIMLIALAVHEATAWWDVGYASKHRHISPVEQHMHSLLEVLPLTAFSVVLLLHWGQFLALFGLGNEPASHGLYWKDAPLPLWYTAGLLSAVFLFAVLPYTEELWRCARWQQRHPPQ